MGAEAMSSSHGSRAGAGGGGALSRQGSVCSLTFSEVDGQPPHGVSLDNLLRSGRKTADEVWRDIQGAAAAAACPRARGAQMTLEDFLSRGGGPPADAADTGSGARGWARQLYQPAPAAAAAQLVELGRRHHRAVGRPVPRPLGAGAGPVLDALYHDAQEGGAAAAAAAGAKRAAAEGGVAERSNERRKKRMIKNRESAARSRARKQAYTNELENKISHLEEENELLRRVHKAPEPVVQYVPQKELKNRLRRINSADF